MAAIMAARKSAKPTEKWAMLYGFIRGGRIPCTVSIDMGPIDGCPTIAIRGVPSEEHLAIGWRIGGKTRRLIGSGQWGDRRVVIRPNSCFIMGGYGKVVCLAISQASDRLVPISIGFGAKLTF